MKQLYIIDYENAHWCGGQLNVCVWATDPEDARIEASDHMEQEQRELFSDQYEEEPEYSDDSAVSINSVEVFDETHPEWIYYNDPGQRAAFYPTIGEPA